MKKKIGIFKKLIFLISILILCFALNIIHNSLAKKQYIKGFDYAYRQSFHDLIYYDFSKDETYFKRGYIDGVFKRLRKNKWDVSEICEYKD